VEGGAAGLDGLGDCTDRRNVRRLDRIGEHQCQVDVAHQRAEPAVGQAAEGVSGDESGAEHGPVPGHRFPQHGEAVFVGLVDQYMMDGR
jgi:hypothetical protein